jgi:oligopeptide transport system substrate-binding protein
MGVVWRAYDPLLDREVALKEAVVPHGADALTATELSARFVREARVAARLTHPGIVAIHAADIYEGRAVIAMELVRGETLAQILRRGPIQGKAVLALFEQLLDAAGYAHGQGIVHRDIKPDNIFLTSDGRVKLADFGIAQLAGGTGLTRTGAVMGTAGYMAPEQVTGDRVDLRADIFALGVVLYEMLCGRNPFGASDNLLLHTILYRIVNCEPPPLADEVVSALPVDVRAVLATALAKNPGERYEDAQAFRGAMMPGPPIPEPALMPTVLDLPRVVGSAPKDTRNLLVSTALAPEAAPSQETDPYAPTVITPREREPSPAPAEAPRPLPAGAVQGAVPASPPSVPFAPTRPRPRRWFVGRGLIIGGAVAFLVLAGLLYVSGAFRGDLSTAGPPVSSTADGAVTTAPAGDTTTEAAAGLAADQTLTVDIGPEPSTIDPNLAVDTTSVKVINNIFEGLVGLNPDGSVFPAAAEKWDLTSDGLTYTFYLRGTDKWSNGDPLTSMDFKDSWIRILDPATEADYAYELYFIEGAEAFNAGNGSADQVAIDATDPRVLKVTLSAPAPWFPSLMAHQAYFPIPKKAVDQFGDQWTEPVNIVTNGPFKLTSWNHGSDITLEKWTDWRDAAEVTLSTVKMVMIDEPTTGVAAFENGEIDIQSDLPIEDMDRLKALPEYQQFPLLAVTYIGFNVEAEPLDNVLVRQALALAIDRQDIVDNVTKGGESPGTGFIPEGMPGFDVITKELLKPTAQIDQARELLAKAGYPDGRGLPEILIYVNTSARHQAVMEAIQEQWKVLGVKATVQTMDWKQYLEFVPADPLVMVYRMAWMADFNDAHNFFEVLRGGGGNNYTRWKNPEYDDGLVSSLSATTDAARHKIYGDMEKILTVEDMPIAPIYWCTNPELVQPYVQGYAPNALGELTNYWTVKILAH